MATNGKTSPHAGTRSLEFISTCVGNAIALERQQLTALAPAGPPLSRPTCANPWSTIHLCPLTQGLSTSKRTKIPFHADTSQILTAILRPCQHYVLQIHRRRRQLWCDCFGGRTFPQINRTRLATIDSMTLGQNQSVSKTTYLARPKWSSQIPGILLGKSFVLK
jgi:hypothetical protein